MVYPGDEPDFVWPDLRLNVEVDGRHHLEPAQMAADEARDAIATDAGWRIIRVQSWLVWRRRAMVVRRIMREIATPFDPLDHGASRKPRRILIK
jgi:very-short-patch-repair endonuclease